MAHPPQLFLLRPSKGYKHNTGVAPGLGPNFTPWLDGLADETTAVEARLVRAEAMCARRGAKLTEIRRNVLRLILQSREPVGAVCAAGRAARAAWQRQAADDLSRAGFSAGAGAGASGGTAGGVCRLPRRWGSSARGAVPDLRDVRAGDGDGGWAGGGGGAGGPRRGWGFARGRWWWRLRGFVRLVRLGRRLLLLW